MLPWLRDHFVSMASVRPVYFIVWLQPGIISRARRGQLGAASISPGTAADTSKRSREEPSGPNAVTIHFQPNTNTEKRLSAL